MATHAETAHRWAHGSRPLKSLNIIHDGNAIYSYGYHWMLGVNVVNQFYFLAEHYGSSSTSKHEGHVRSSIPHIAEKAYDVPQDLLKAIEVHFRGGHYETIMSSRVIRLAGGKMREAIDLARSKPYINTGHEYAGLQSHIYQKLAYALDLDVFISRAASRAGKPYDLCRERIIEVYREVIDEEMADKSKFQPYVMDLIRDAVYQDADYTLLAWRSVDWSARYPGYAERLADLRESDQNRVDAVVAAGRGRRHGLGRALTEEQWQEWYNYEKGYYGNDVYGFARLRLLKSDNTRVQSSIGTSWPLSEMRMALIAYDRGMGQLPEIRSSAGTFGSATIYRNGSDETSYAIYGCHKVRISEARKLIQHDRSESKATN